MARSELNYCQKPEVQPAVLGITSTKSNKLVLAKAVAGAAA
jgi:hypothetical protein